MDSLSREIRSGCAEKRFCDNLPLFSESFASHKGRLEALKEILESKWSRLNCWKDEYSN